MKSHHLVEDRIPTECPFLAEGRLPLSCYGCRLRAQAV
jgi:hypothetical protein